MAAFVDLDADGFGVSDPFDRHQQPGGLRFFCNIIPPGHVVTGGDCDDNDPAWTPALIQLAPDRRCEHVTSDNLDADAYPAGVDANDLDGMIQ